MVKKSNKYPERRTFYNPESEEVRDWLDSQSNLTNSLELAIMFMIRTFGEGDLLRNYIAAQGVSSLRIEHNAPVSHIPSSMPQVSVNNIPVASNDMHRPSMENFSPPVQSQPDVEVIQPQITPLIQSQPVEQQITPPISQQPEPSTTSVAPDHNAAIAAMMGFGASSEIPASRGNRSLEDVIREQQNNNNN